MAALCSPERARDCLQREGYQPLSLSASITNDPSCKTLTLRIGDPDTLIPRLVGEQNSANRLCEGVFPGSDAVRVVLTEVDYQIVPTIEVTVDGDLAPATAADVELLRRGLERDVMALHVDLILGRV